MPYLNRFSINKTKSFFFKLRSHPKNQQYGTRLGGTYVCSFCLPLEEKNLNSKDYYKYFKTIFMQDNDDFRLRAAAENMTLVSTEIITDNPFLQVQNLKVFPTC